MCSLWNIAGLVYVFTLAMSGVYLYDYELCISWDALVFLSIHQECYKNWFYFIFMLKVCGIFVQVMSRYVYDTCFDKNQVM